MCISDVRTLDSMTDSQSPIIKTPSLPSFLLQSSSPAPESYTISLCSLKQEEMTS